MINLLITLNTVALALYSYPSNEEREEIADLINDVISWFFLLEMLIKLGGFGLKGYVRDPFNIFDGFIVVLSLVDFVLSQSLEVNEGSGSGAL